MSENNIKTTAGQSQRRWYDQHPKLSAALEKLKPLKGKALDNMMIDLKNIICKHDPDLIDKYCSKFPMSPYKRRWYDRDPYLWLVVNALRYADQSILDEIIDCIDNRSS